MATTGQLISLFAGAGFRDSDDAPVGSGTVYVAEAGTSYTAANVWTDRDKTTIAPNVASIGGESTYAFALDANGRAEVYGDNIYKFRVFDANDVLVEEIDFVEYRSLIENNFATYTELKATSVRGVASVQGRASANDGGGGVFRWDASDLSTEVAVDTQGGIYVPPDSDTSGASGAWVRSTDVYYKPEWFGVTKDGVADDATGLQACITTATNFGAPVWLTGTYYVKSPIQIPDGANIDGAARTTATAEATIKAITPFTSTLTMAYYDPKTASNETYNVAAVIVSKAWVDGSNQGNAVYLGHFLVDGGSVAGGTLLYDNRSAPIHGALLNNQISDFAFGAYNTTGHGIWMNSQKTDGEAGGTMVSTTWDGNRIGNTGIGEDVYTINDTDWRYNAFHGGPLEGARSTDTAAGNPTISGKVTDGKMERVVIAEICFGHGVRLLDGGGWYITGIHTNFTGLNGILIDGADHAVIDGNFLDGAMDDAPDNYGIVSGIKVTGVFQRNFDIDGHGPIISNNVITLRNKNGTFNTTGNTFIPIFVQSNGAGSETLIVGNKFNAGNDATATEVAATVALGSALTGGTVRYYGNDYQTDAYNTLFPFANTDVIYQEANSWQYAAISDGLTITNCADNGSGAIRVTVGSTATLATGDKVSIAGVVGTTEANGVGQTITVIDGTNFDIDGSTFTNPYTSGGFIADKPKRGWHPEGMYLTVTDPGKTNPARYLCVNSGTPGEWVAISGGERRGTTALRPVLDNSDVGFLYWDTTIGKQITWTGTGSTGWKTPNVAFVDA